MRDSRFSFALAAAIAALLVAAGTLLMTRGPVDALLLIVVVTGLAGLYKLRHYARAKLLYDRDDPEPHRPELDLDVETSSASRHDRPARAARPGRPSPTGGTP